MLIGAIEGGGTKFVCGIIDELGNIHDKQIIKTESPEVTLNNVIEYFSNKNYVAIGFACFGPICLNKKSKDYGKILNSPKLEWIGFNVYRYLKIFINKDIYLTTDVNAACLGEVTFGSSRFLTNVLYITIGTGIGAGAYMEGKLMYGVSHPEMGHITLNKYPNDDFKGICPYHEYCFEGLVSGPALEKHFGINPKDINDEKIYDYIGYYIGQALASYTFMLNPERIIIGGGVSNKDEIFPIAKEYFKKFNNNYISNQFVQNIDEYIIKASLGDNAGILGCCSLAFKKIQKKNK